MCDTNYRLENLNNLSKLKKHKETAQKTELLDLFATYVHMTNPDYKYNETYLKDMIPEFWSNVDKYNAKVEFREKMLNEIQKCLISESVKCHLCIQIDETWELRFDNISEGSTSEWKRTVSEMPKLNSVDVKKTYVNCQFSNGMGVVFSDYLISEDKDKLRKFASDSVKSFVDRLEE